MAVIIEFSITFYWIRSCLCCYSEFFNLSFVNSDFTYFIVSGIIIRVMQKLFRLAPLPVVVLGLFASFFINLSLSSPTEALICPAGQVEVFRGVPQYRQCATPTNRKPNEVPCAERGDDRKTILVDGECFMPAYETGSTCFNWT